MADTGTGSGPDEPRILVVEDDDDIAVLIRKLLEKRFAANVTDVSTCADARRELASGAYDVVTLDYKLPDGNGLQLLEDLSSGGGPLAIVVTGRGDEEVASQALQFGAAGYILKGKGLEAALQQVMEKALDRVSLAKMNAALELERQQLLSIFDSIDDPIYVSDPDTYEILYANQMVRHEFGDVLGKKCFEELQGLEAPCSFCTNSLIFGDRTGIPYIWEFQNRRNNRWYRCIDKAIRWPDGRMVRSEIAIEITDVKLAEERIRFQAYLLHAVEQAVIASDLDGRIIFLNRYAEKLYGWTAAEALGQSILELFPSQPMEKFQDEIEALILAGESWSGEMTAHRRDGTEFHAMVRAAPIHDEHGNVSGLVSIVADVSYRKRAEEALQNVVRETNERREEISALLESTRYVLEHSDFGDAARAVHELCSRLIGARAGFLALLDEEHKKVNVLLEEGINSKEGADIESLLSERMPRSAIRSGSTGYDNDLASSAAQEHPGGVKPPLDNLLCAPLVVDGETAGVMCFGNKAGGFSKRDELMAGAFSEITALALRSTYAYELLEDSEWRFRSVAETANEGIICIDTDLRITFWNQAAERIFGYSSEEMIGRVLDVLLPERFREIDHEVLSRLKERGLTAGGRTYEQLALRKGGFEFPAELSFSAWSLGGEQYFTVIIRDITERTRSQEALRESEERYRRLFETAPDIIYTISNDGTLTSVNPAFEALTGWSMEDWVGKSFEGLVHPDDLQKAIETFEQASGGASPPPYELRILTSSGGYIYGEFTSTPQVVKGEVVGELGIMRNIDDRKSAEAAFQEAEKKYIELREETGALESPSGPAAGGEGPEGIARDELERAVVELDAFAHTVSHDLKAPLSNISMSSMVLARMMEEANQAQMPPGAVELARLIGDNLTKAYDMVNNLLTLAEAGQKPQQVSLVSISGVVGDIRAEADAEIAARGIRFEVDDDLGSVRGDYTQLYQLFSNLIWNAIKYDDSPGPVIEVRRLSEGGVHRYLVKDNGPGIAPQDLDRIFMPYFAGKKGGHGIGLMTAQKIISVYDGRIKAYNDGGACFEFEIRDYPGPD